MKYNIEKLRKLRELTEVGISECIKALQASDNDLTKALEWLKERSLVVSKSAKQECLAKPNQSGLVVISNTREQIVAFALKCESDFVAMNGVFTKLAGNISLFLTEHFTTLATATPQQLKESLKDLISNASYTLGETIYIEKISFFAKEKEEVLGQYNHHNGKVAAFVVVDRGSEALARELSIQAVANAPLFLTREDIPATLVTAKLAEIRELVTNRNSTKTASVIEQISRGMFDKWISEICFLEQNDFKEPTRKIKQILQEAKVQIKSLFIIDLNN